MELLRTVLPFVQAYGIVCALVTTITFLNFLLRPKGSRKGLPFILAASVLFGACWWFMLPVFSFQGDGDKPRDVDEP